MRRSIPCKTKFLTNKTGYGHTAEHDAKISALNGLADENGKDVPEVAKERKTLEDSAAKYKSLLAQEALALAKIDEINALIFKARNKELLTSVLAKQSSIFNPNNFGSHCSASAAF